MDRYEIYFFVTLYIILYMDGFPWILLAAGHVFCFFWARIFYEHRRENNHCTIDDQPSVYFTATMGD